MKKQTDKFPKGWDPQRVQRVLDHYEKQTPEEAAAEDEAAWQGRKESTMSIPIALVPQVRKLIARRRAG
jgi:hypothetical protein